MNDVKEIISFLTDLSENNNKDWFHANRQRYTDAKKMAEVRDEHYDIDLKNAYELGKRLAEKCREE